MTATSKDWLIGSTGSRKEGARTLRLTRESSRLDLRLPSSLDFEKHGRGILPRLFDRDERRHRLPPLDDPVIVGHGEVVRRTHDDLSVLHHPALLGPVDAEDRALRGIDYRRGEHRAEHATVRNRERAAGQLLD